MKRHLLSVIVVALVACGNDERKGFEPGPSEATAHNEPPPAAGSQDGATGDAAKSASSPGVGYPPGSCSPLSCKSGCCTGDGKCVEGTAPATCGKGGLVCMNCSAMGFGCVDQGCNPAATCPGCDGCCKAGTCNAYGKTQDSACGSGGALCRDCTSSGQTCDGNGSCH